MEEQVLEKRLAGSPVTRFFQELFGNSAQFPIANILFELLLEGPRRYLVAPDAYAILLAALGRELLARSMEYAESLALRRHERTVLFMDIRGFTAWSEARPPESVVALLNRYYHAAAGLESNAGAGEVLVSAAVAERVPRAAHLGTARLVAAKGKQLPIEAYPLVQ